MAIASILQGTWTCRKCGKTYGPERHEHDFGLCIRCSKYNGKEKVESLHLQRATRVLKLLNDRKEDKEISCKDHGKDLIQTSISDDRIVTICMKCNTVLKEEKRKQVNRRCITCGRNISTPEYSSDEYEVISSSHHCIQHGVEGSIDERIKIRHPENTLTTEGSINENIDCLVRQNVCHMYDQWIGVKIGVFKWLKDELKSKIGEKEFKKLMECE